MKTFNLSKTKMILFFLTISGIFYSCDEGGELDPGATEVVDMAGDWYVQTQDESGAVLLDYTLISTYNTSANESEMWVDDHSNIWIFKCKTPVNTSSLTFSGMDLESSIDDDGDPATPNYEITVNISEGKILKDAATTAAGNVTDSIYFKAEFSDDPGTIYQIAGYKRTGFLEDEH